MNIIIKINHTNIIIKIEAKSNKEAEQEILSKSTHRFFKKMKKNLQNTALKES